MPMLLFRFSLILFSVSCLGQYREVYEKELWYLQQPDSLYKANKVKTRTTYRLSDLNQAEKVQKLKITFDREGRVIEMQYPAFFGGRVQTSYFQYDANGSLSTMYSVLVKGQPTKEVLNFIGDDPELMQKIKDLPKRETLTYERQNSGDSIMIYRKFNGEAKWQAEMITRSDKLLARFMGPLKENRVTRYLPNKAFQWLPTFYTFWYGEGPPTKSFRFEYQFTGNQVRELTVREFYRNEIYSTDTFLLQYNKKGLLTRAAQDYGTHVYEYTYY